MKQKILELVEKYLKEDIQDICRYVCIRYISPEKRQKIIDNLRLI